MALHHMLRAAAAQQNAAPSDPYFYDVSLLLTGDGTNGAQNNTFLDSSTNNFTITRNGNTTQGTFSPYGNLWSNYFASSGSSYLSAGSGSSTLAFGTGDFTIEGWFFATTTTTGWQPFVSVGTNSAGQLIRLNQSVNNSGQYGFLYPNSTNNGDVYVYSGSAFPTNQWVHLALVRNGTNLTLYTNGTQAAQATGVGFNFTNTSGALIGYGAYAGDGYYNGYISNFRIVKGTALYTSNFTPSTTPLTAVSGTSLLTCQSNRFIDNSSNNFTLTVNGNTSVQRFSPFNPTAPYSAATIGGSGYFDGTGDSLTFSGGVTNVGTGDFCLELWTCFTGSYGTYTTIWDSRTTAGGYTDGFALVLDTNGDLCISLTVLDLNTSTPIAQNQWQHICVTRQSGTIRLFANGVLAGTLSNSSNFTSTTNRIGQNWNNTYYYTGYVSNLRAVKSSVPAAYQTSSTTVGATIFTPPTAPLTAITNTSLLCNFTNAGIPDAAMMNDLETVGNAQVSTSVKKYGTGSLYFDGSGDFLYSPSSNANGLGTGDFTIEFWLYYLGGNGYVCFLNNFGSGGTNTYIYYGLQSGTLHPWIWSDTSVLEGSTNITNSTWQHHAVVRKNGTVTIYLDGTSIGSATWTADLGQTRPLVIGAAGTNGAQPTYGYIDDLRITKGYARYTTNFTPPTAALPTF